MGTNRTRQIGAVAAATMLAVAACSGGGDGGGTGGDDGGGDGAGGGGVVELEFWSWAPNIEQVVEVWNEENPDIQVSVNSQDAGDAAVTKFLTAIEAGSGAPDLIQAEYQAIPTMVAAGGLADISGDIGDDVQNAFSEGTWSAVTLGTDAAYAIPQDVGPMLFYYRADVFDELGLEPPATWDEYAEVARAVHESDPNRYLGTFSSSDAGWFVGLSQQAGASWWGVEGEAWTVNIDEEPTRRVAEYWGGLVEEDVIDNKPMYTPEWNAALNDGTQVGWLSAVWAPGVLAGNAGETAGLWEAAPMPQWDAENPATGNWGGSATAVSAQTEHTAAAVEFATWVNTSDEGTTELVETSALYPAAEEAQQTALTDPPEFLSNQPDFYEIAGQAASTVTSFTYGPNVNVAYSAYNDEFGQATEARSREGFLEALSRVQAITIEDLRNSGYAVSD